MTPLKKEKVQFEQEESLKDFIIDEVVWKNEQMHLDSFEKKVKPLDF